MMVEYYCWVWHISCGLWDFAQRRIIYRLLKEQPGQSWIIGMLMETCFVDSFGIYSVF